MNVRALPATRTPWPTLRIALLVAGAILLVLVNLAGLLQLIRIAPNGTTGDWSYFGQLDPWHPYEFRTFFRWAPIAAVGWHYLVIPLGWQMWVALHVAALGVLRDWRVIALALLSWPFWEDAMNGNVLTFVMVAAWSALRGDKAGVAAYCILAALMPRPLMLPVLAWLLWRRPEARWWTLGAGVAVLASSLAMSQMDEWVGRLLMSADNEISAIHNIGPSMFLGTWWLLIGIPLGAWLTYRGRLGLASLAVSPYWLSYYGVILLLELLPRHDLQKVVGVGSRGADVLPRA